MSTAKHIPKEKSLKIKFEDSELVYSITQGPVILNYDKDNTLVSIEVSDVEHIEIAD
jgi:hypothetical protein